MQTKEELKGILVNDYLNYFLNFFISKVSFVDIAEDLVQTTAYECLISIDKIDKIENVNAYFWSIAHNVFKKWLNKKNNYVLLNDDYYKNVICNIADEKTSNENEILHNLINESLSILSGTYRKILVYYYYQELKINEIASILNLSVEMVKYYLSSSKKKLKEIYFMEKVYGEKSFNPSEFSVYYSGIDFAKINIWDIFRKKLPGQIALICFKTPKTISEIVLETGVPSCYLEDELEILLNAGLMKETSKGKYQTNFFILNNKEVKQIEQLFLKMYENFVAEIKIEFDNNYQELINTKVFNFENTRNMYKWLFADSIASFDDRQIHIKETDYPKILSCGARAVIFAKEQQYAKNDRGQTPIYLNQHTLWARDVYLLNNEVLYQKILKNETISQTIINVYNNKIKEDQTAIYAQLIQYNLLKKENGKLVCNIAYKNKAFKKFMERINKELYPKLEKKSNEIIKFITNIVEKNIPNNLKNYINGYTMTLIQYFSGIDFYETLIKENFLNIDLNIQLCYFEDNNLNK